MKTTYTQSEVFVGPFEEARLLSTGLDFYKPTMSQVAFEKNRDAEVTFTFKNRGKESLAEYVDLEQLQERLDARRSGWTEEEVEYLASLTTQDQTPRFSEEFLIYLQENDLPPVRVGVNEEGDLAIDTKGDWALVTFWETVVMSEVNELYFETKVRRDGLDVTTLYELGDQKLSEKIALLQSRPDIQFADFGTRRRFSYRWQNHVIERLLNECPGNFVGTSNVYLAKKYGVNPIGTFAHEMPMVYAALAHKEGRNPLEGHNEMIQDWEEVYKGELSTALTDTFTSEFFFADFTPEQAQSWKALRHDSGDPVEFGNRVIEFYEELGINPLEKTIVFSDGLDIETIVMLADTFKDRINVLFGWGTTLTNDLGLKSLNIVMKATMVDGMTTVKLSDDAGKHTGTEENIKLYNNNVTNVVELANCQRQEKMAQTTGTLAIGAA